MAPPAPTPAEIDFSPSSTSSLTPPPRRAPIASVTPHTPEEPVTALSPTVAAESTSPSPQHSAVSTSLWNQVLSSDVKRSLKTFLAKLTPVSLTPGLAILEVPADLIEIARTNQREVEQLIATLSGKRTTVEYRELGVTRTSPAAPSPGFETPPPAAAITEHPVIKRAAELFNARVVSVQPRRRNPTPAPAPTPAPTIPSATGDESGPEPEQSSGDSD